MAEYIERDKVLAEADYDGNFVLVVPAKKIRNIPAADVVEVKHGRWVWNSIENPLHRICNQCGAVYRIVEGDFPYNVCPNCGAKMRGEGP